MLKSPNRPKSDVTSIYVTKYNRFVDNILGRINKILSTNYDPVTVKLSNPNSSSKSNKTKFKKKNSKRKSNKKGKRKSAMGSTTTISDNSVELKNGTSSLRFSTVAKVYADLIIIF